jgi:response regulator of citrate/malate metabolism
MIADAIDAVDSALAATVIEAQRFEQVTANQVTQPRNLIARCQETQARLGDLTAVVTTHSPEPLTEADALEVVTAASLYRWWAFRDDAVYACTEIADVMRQVQATARRRLQKADRLYMVKTGDTLESIALARLGSIARASEFGLLPQQLLPGRFIRIPKV